MKSAFKMSTKDRAMSLISDNFPEKVSSMINQLLVLRGDIERTGIDAVNVERFHEKSQHSTYTFS